MAKIAVSDIRPDMRVSFSMYGQIGSVKKIVGTVTGQVSGKFLPPNANGYENHANIYPLLPDATKATVPNDHTRYRYYEVIRDDGSRFFVGEPWIIEATLESIQTTTATVTLVDFSSERNDELMALLSQNGFNVSSIVVN